MPCYHPIPGYRATVCNPSGKRSIVFSPQEGFKEFALAVPCGRCIGCRLERARQWSIRCVHESSLYERNCFITLTYSDDNLPLDGSLRPRDMTLFLKRLRKMFGSGIRYFQCGEYGEKSLRPHHHAILFNHDFSDKRSMSNPLGPSRLFTSRTLEDLWGYGHCSVGTVTRQSAGYVARYSLKKVYGPSSVDWYAGRVPEYLTMSRRPGIGTGWLAKWHDDIYRGGDSVSELVVDGVRCKPPRFYDKLMERFVPSMMERVNWRRKRESADNPDGSGSRLIVREHVTEAAVKSLTRGI